MRQWRCRRPVAPSSNASKFSIAKYRIHAGSDNWRTRIRPMLGHGVAHR
jgi:hypothetical protein